MADEWPGTLVSDADQWPGTLEAGAHEAPVNKFDWLSHTPEPTAPRFDYGATLDQYDDAANAQWTRGLKAIKEASDPLNPSIGGPFKAAGGLYDMGASVVHGMIAPATAAVRAYATQPLSDATSVFGEGIPPELIEGAVLSGGPGRGPHLPAPAARSWEAVEKATRPNRASALSLPGTLQGRGAAVDMDALERAVIPEGGARPVPGAEASPAPRLLPPDTPHDIPARASVGAAATEGIGPLSDISPETQSMLRKLFAENGFSNPHILEQALDERSAHHMLGELTPGIENQMSRLVVGDQGAARNEITNAVMERARQAPERMAAVFDRAFGPGQNRAQLQRTWAAERDEASRPFWDRFRQTVVPPTPQIRALMPRLRHSGAIAAADRSMGIEGLPANQGFGPPGKAENIPTAQAFQYAKEHLDDQIEAALAKPGGENKARIFTKLKNDLVNAIDQHPDKNVAGVWKDAREVYATPTRIMRAAKLGERILTNHIHRDELPFITASFGPQERQALAIGMRGHLEDLEMANRNPARTSNRLMDAVLTPGNRQKIAAVIGDQRANEMINSMSHEATLHGAPGRIIQGSATAGRTSGDNMWLPKPSIFDASINDVMHRARHPGQTVAKYAAKVGLDKLAAKRAADAARIREEAARFLTLQGAEGINAAHALMGHSAQNVVSFRASGGRVTGH